MTFFNYHNCCDICGSPFEYKITDTRHCLDCIKKPPPYSKLRSIFEYNEHSKRLILNFKLGDKLHLSNYFSSLINDKKLLDNTDIVTPVPMHKSKLRKRKFNQSALIAKSLAHMNNIEYAPQILLKKINTPNQSSVSKTKRIKNAKKAYVFNDYFHNLVVGKNITLIDDVTTTGATINACCTSLTRAGASEIKVVTLARKFI